MHDVVMSTSTTDVSSVCSMSGTGDLSHQVRNKVMSWIREQVQKDDVQVIWREDIIRPFLDSFMNILMKDYIHYMISIIVIWALLIALFVVVGLVWFRSATSF